MYDFLVSLQGIGKHDLMGKGVFLSLEIDAHVDLKENELEIFAMVF